MARVEIATQSWGVLVDQFGNSLVGVSVSITKLDGSAATHYSAVTGGTSSTAELVSQSDGTLPDFIDDGQYIVTPAGKPSHRVEAVSGGDGVRLDVVESSVNAAGASDKREPYWDASTGRMVWQDSQVFDPRMFGAKFDGTSDDRAGMEACRDAAIVAASITGRGAVIQMPAGVCNLASQSATAPTNPSTGADYTKQIGIALPCNLTSPIIVRGRGDGVTTVRLSDNARNAFYIDQKSAVATVTTANGNATLNSVNVTKGTFAVGQVVIGAGIPAGTTIQSLGSGTITLTAAATAGATNVTIVAVAFDTFRNLTLEDFSVDNNSAVGRGHVLIGSIPAAITPQRYLSYDTITVRRISVKNVPREGAFSPTTSNKGAVLLLGTHSAANEATQTTTSNILVEDVDVQSGAHGIEVASWGVGSTSTNHYYDRVTYRRCNVKHGASPSTGWWSETSFFICGSGSGDRYRIEDCHSFNSGDDAFEFGAMMRGSIENCSATDSYLESLLFRNSRALDDVSRQRVQIVNFRHRTTSALGAQDGQNANSGPSGNQRPACMLVNWMQDSTYNHGTFDFTGVSYSGDGMSWTRMGQRSGIAAKWDSSATVAKRTFLNFRARLTNFAADVASGTQDMALIDNQSASGIVTFREIDTVCAITANAGGNVNWLTLHHHGAGQQHVDGYDADVNGSVYSNGSGGGMWHYAIARSGSVSGLRGSVANLRPVNPSGVGVGVRPFQIGSTVTIGSFSLRDSDFSSASSMNSDISYSATANDARVSVDNVIGKAGQRLGPDGFRAINALTDTMVPHDGTLGVASPAGAHAITLPSWSAVRPGHTFTIADERNDAATNNITITAAGTDTFVNGSTSTTVVINTNGGSRRIVPAGASGKWLVV